jgi:glycogen debranching enzyme
MDLVYPLPDVRCAWHGSSLLVTTARGECVGGRHLSGYFFREARHLSTLAFEIGGERAWLCESAVHEPETLSFSFVHRELTSFSGGGSGRAEHEPAPRDDGIPWRALDITCRMRVSAAALDVELTIVNRSPRTTEFEVAWVLGADFADLVAVSSDDPADAASPEALERDGDTWRFRRSDPALSLGTRIRVDGGGSWTARDDRLATHLTLIPRQRAVLALRIQPCDPLLPVPDDVDRREDQWRRWRDTLTRVDVPPNAALQRIIARSIGDIASFPLLEGREDEWLAPAAGVPMYPALFGRDAVTATWQAAMLDRGEALDAVLTRLGRLQGEHDVPERDEEPGRIIQQTRSGPLSRLGRLPFARYYGDYASPLMFVISLAHLYAWTGDRDALGRHWDAARRVLDWARERGDRDGDGYLEYVTHARGGAENQGWKDSGDAIIDDAGTPLRTPLATCELQGYWYAAQELMAVLSWITGAREDARAYWRSAMALKERFNRDWWIEDEGFLGLAMDAQKRLARSVGSNVGHCLASGIISDDHIPRVVGRLFQHDLFSGWGIRTLSSAHTAYDPISYHRGSVWAVENATIVFGLRRFGFDTRAVELAAALFDLAALYPDGRIPETVGGYARTERPTPGLYPRANSPQLWNASAIPLLVHSVLGLQPVAPLDLLVVDPVLPSWLPEVVLRGLRLGGATVSLRFWRADSGESHVEVLHRRGTFHLLRQPPPESLTAGVRDRFSALADRVLHH